MRPQKMPIPAWQLQAGDVLWYWKLGVPPVKHYALVVQPNVVLENTPLMGEHLAPLDGVLTGRQVFVESRNGWNATFEARLQQILRNPRSYDLVARNCQATVNQVISGFPTSSQVALGGIAAIIVIGLLLASGSKAV